MVDLSGKTAVITGAASGIGRASVEVFVKAGARVVAADIQEEAGRALEERYGADQVRFALCDVTRRQELDAAIRLCVSAYGGLDIMFNNAGAGGSGATIETFDPDGFDSTVALLLKSVLMGTHLAIPHLKARGGGAVINTSSISALRAGDAPIVYSVCKSGVAHFSKLAAAELGKHKIRVNAVLPGLIGTAIFGSAFGLGAAESAGIVKLLEEKAKDSQPMGRIGQGEDVAELVAFLGSDAAAFISGAAITVDGGATVGAPDSWRSDMATRLMETLGLSPEQAQGMIAAMR
ncbi:MAG: SDR family oxidoreductase [Pseudomonadota bacterium]